MEWALHAFIIFPLQEEHWMNKHVEESYSWMAHAAPSSSHGSQEGAGFGFPGELLIFQ